MVTMKVISHGLTEPKGLLVRFFMFWSIWSLGMAKTQQSQTEMFRENSEVV